MIQLYHIDKTFESEFSALHDVSLKIEKGEFVFLVGPSGAGKTTLLRLIICDELPTRGQIIVRGRNLAKINRTEIAHLRRSVGVVFQDFKLLTDRTAYENLDFALLAVGMARKERKKRILEVLQQVRLTNKQNSFPLELSGGEQQRVAIARAMANYPHIILADEPTGNLDPQIAKDIIQTLLDINQRGTTVLLATHNLDMVRSMNKRVIYIDHGRVTGGVVEEMSYQ